MKLSLDSKLTGAASAGQSPARTFARKPVYQVDPRSAEKWPSDDGTSLIIKQALQKSQISDEDKQRAFSVGNWFLRVFYPCCEELSKDLDDSDLKFKDASLKIQDALNVLDPRPDFNFSRFASDNTTLRDRHLYMVGDVVSEEILMPNGIISTQPTSKSFQDVSFILDKPEYFISYSGRLVPIFYSVATIRGSYEGQIVNSKYVVEPTELMEQLRHTYENGKANHETYISGGFNRDRDLNLLQNPDMLGVWGALHYYVHCSGRGSDALIEDQRPLMLDMSDSVAACEAKLGRRIARYMPQDFIYHAKLITQEDSEPKARLNSLNDVEKMYHASAVEQLRIHCLNMGHTEFPAFDFISLVAPQLIPKAFALHIKREEMVAEEALRLFGPHFSNSLEVSPNGKFVERNRRAWRVWLNNKLKGRDRQGDTKAIADFNEAVKAAATAIIDKHFVRDLDEIAPSGWRDMEIDFKEWTDPLLSP